MSEVYSRSQVADKIQLLLNLAERAGTKEEAETALAKAHTLMLKYSIEELDLRARSAERDSALYRDLLLYRGKVRKYQHYLICYLVGNYFNVKVFSYRIPHRETRTFAFGTETNTEFAKYAHDFLCNIFEILWDKMKKEVPFLGKEHSRSYYAGLADGFESTLKKERELLSGTECTALMVIGKELEQATEQAHPDLRSKSIKFDSDGKKKFFPGLHQRGVQDGKEIKINKRIEAPST